MLSDFPTFTTQRMASCPIWKSKRVYAKPWKWAIPKTTSSLIWTLNPKLPQQKQNFKWITCLWPILLHWKTGDQCSAANKMGLSPYCQIWCVLSCLYLIEGNSIASSYLLAPSIDKVIQRDCKSFGEQLSVVCIAVKSNVISLLLALKMLPTKCMFNYPCTEKRLEFPRMEKRERKGQGEAV